MSSQDRLDFGGSDVKDLVCMLLQDVDVVQDPANPDGRGSRLGSVLPATTTIVVDRVESFGDKEYARISKPASGWIVTKDEYDNPNIPLYTP